ncbi:hypothetical protein TrVE_jg10219, partial [Triparma verrucosa]
LDALDVSNPLQATAMNGAKCSADGITLDGDDDFVNIDVWKWGASTSFEIYFFDEQESASKESQLFDFRSYDDTDGFYLSTLEGWGFDHFNEGDGHEKTYLLPNATVSKVERREKLVNTGSWTHLVGTVSNDRMKIYKDGVLQATVKDTEPMDLQIAKDFEATLETYEGSGGRRRQLNNAEDFFGTTRPLSNGELSSDQRRLTDFTCPAGKEIDVHQQTSSGDRRLYGSKEEDVETAVVGARRLTEQADHFWDFRGCTTGAPVIDSFENLAATPMNGPTCSADGLSLDGNNDYADITNFEFGGTTSIEVYVKYDSFNSWSRVFDFSNGQANDNVFLGNFGTTSTIRWSAFQGSTEKMMDTSNFDSSTWTHVVVTVSGTTMKIYKNGALAGTKTDGQEPNVLTRTQHWLGRSAWSTDGYFDGTIAYVKMWHGVELQQLDVTDLYAPHNTAHHFWDFRGCTTGGSVTDSIAGDLVATPVNGPVCGGDGLRLDGNNDYADIDDWEWGGTTSFEVYVKYDSFNIYSRVFDFGSGGSSDNVFLNNVGTTSNLEWGIFQGSTHKGLYPSNFDSSTWTHVVATVSGTTMKVYKNGVLAGTKTDGHEPNVLTRTDHIIGSSHGTGAFMDGTIAYVKMWHGVELQQSDVTSLYSPHNTAHHFWDFRGCTTGAPITDSISGELKATPMNGPICGAD